MDGDDELGCYKGLCSCVAILYVGFWLVWIFL